MLAEGLIISSCFVQVSTTPKHRSTHIWNYQSSKHKLNQHDESDDMIFLCILKNALLTIRDRFGMSFASKELGYLAALLLLLSLLARYKLSCYQTTLLLTISALADITLLKTTCHFLLLLIWFDTLTYRKELQLIPYTFGSSRLFSGGVAREWSAFGKWNFVRKHLYSVLKFIVTWYYGK